VTMDFAIDKRTEGFRAEVRAFLDTELTPEIRHRVHETGTAHDWGMYRAMAARGWIGAAWPAEEGGQGRDAFDMEILYYELASAGAPTDGFSISMIVAETLRRVGTPAQRDEVVPRIQAGELVVALGYSEPEAGSDLAAVTTRATRDGDGWRIDGQKAFTTLAHEAGFVFLLARTDPAGVRHHGLTVFLVPTDAPGFSLDPVHTLGGERTNMTYYTDVHVPDSARVGEVGGGWSVVMLALAFERGGEFAAQLRRLVDDAGAWVRREGREHDRNVLRRLGQVAADAEVARLLGTRATWLRAGERAGDIEGSMAKLYATEALLRGATELLAAAGPEGVLDGPLSRTYRHAQVTTIYGGTSEILRGMIAERRLGLPRGRTVDVAAERARQKAAVS
jgi:alkylation response protein AidB-like acyl-CoA dehydrogenase